MHTALAGTRFLFLIIPGKTQGGAGRERSDAMNTDGQANGQLRCLYMSVLVQRSAWGCETADSN